MASDASHETREDIPLKSGGRQKSWNCSSCFSGDDCLGGSRLVSTSFGVLSVVITFALLLQIYYGDYQVVPHGSVASDSRECSEIGTATLKKGGNAADAAIATAFCLAVVNPHFTGLDAEGQFMIYNHRTRDPPQVITFRRNVNTKIAEILPRLVIGLSYIHQQHASMTWRQLLEPAILLAQRGFFIPKSLALAIDTANVQSLYGHLEAGQFAKITPKLAETLQSYADIAEEDLRSYITLENTPTSSTALCSKLNEFNICVPNAPSIGPELLMNMQRIGQNNFTKMAAVQDAEYYYHIGETTKLLYEDLNITSNYHEGTSSNIAVIDKDDNYVSLVTGMFQLFGSRELNPAGYITDVKTSVNIACSRVPIIVTDAEVVCGRRLILGANNIATASQVLSGLLIAGNNVTTGVEIPRFNLFNDGSVGFEDDHNPSFPDEVVGHFEKLGRQVHIKEPYGSCNVVEKMADTLSSHSDSRGGGISSRFR
ncbi:glutathione hydrolase 7-like [Atheta coriaria]|uniref:glutathione hydrolase 7-like n=1 Tax=Dalotia coriaria TaxID=877792 RepID=UPI0031F3C762